MATQHDIYMDQRKENLGRPASAATSQRSAQRPDPPSTDVLVELTSVRDELVDLATRALSSDVAVVEISRDLSLLATRLRKVLDAVVAGQVLLPDGVLQGTIGIATPDQSLSAGAAALPEKSVSYD